MKMRKSRLEDGVDCLMMNDARSCRRCSRQLSAAAHGPPTMMISILVLVQQLSEDTAFPSSSLSCHTAQEAQSCKERSHAFV